MVKILNKTREFLNSFYFPLTVFSLVLISHTFSIELLGASIILFCVFIGLLICDDLKFIISPLLMFIFAFSQKSISSGKFFSDNYIIAIVILSCVLSLLLFTHFIIYRKHINFKSIFNSKLLIGYLLICLSFLLNGLFSFENYTIKNLLYALILCLSFVFVFFVFYINFNVNESSKKYVFFVLYLLSLLITIQMFIGFINQFRFNNGEIIKESIMLGWGMWNNIGGMLALLLPIHFYFASTIKRFGVFFYFSGVISYIAIALTLSRSSLLVSSLIIVICALISCFHGKNKKTNRYITIGISILGLLGLIILWDKISNILGDYLSRGLDDNGRFDIYRYGLSIFAENPIFGHGFYSDYKLEHTFISFLPFRYHNTVIQLLATCGIFGLISYIFHRFQTIKLIVSGKSLYSTYAGLCILALIMCSLLDNHMFNIYPAFVYSIIFATIDKSHPT